MGVSVASPCAHARACGARRWRVLMSTHRGGSLHFPCALGAGDERSYALHIARARGQRREPLATIAGSRQRRARRLQPRMPQHLRGRWSLTRIGDEHIPHGRLGRVTEHRPLWLGEHHALRGRRAHIGRHGAMGVATGRLRDGRRRQLSLGAEREGAAQHNVEHHASSPHIDTGAICCRVWWICAPSPSPPTPFPTPAKHVRTRMHAGTVARSTRAILSCRDGSVACGSEGRGSSPGSHGTAIDHLGCAIEWRADHVGVTSIQKSLHLAVAATTATAW